MTSCLKILTSRLTLVRRLALVTTILAILFCIADFSNERQVVDARERREVRLKELLTRFPRQENANFSEYELNVTVSNALPVDRAIPDVRSPACRQIVYDLDSLPDVSVIIPFHNEAWSILLRAVHSILNRTPGRLLREIILVDDLSTRSYLKQTLTEYVENLSGKIRILRNSVREGLIRSRVRAAKVASGEVLVFLDAHVEVNVDWLPPLLVTILSQDRKTLAVPLIDNIDDQTIEYSNWDYMVHGGFTWTMDYVWKFLPRRLRASRKAETDPIRTPTTIGCAMAVDRKFFFDLGEFDNGMFIWGGENLEISIRMWTCGGSVYISPCSRVGHVFRRWLPYEFPTRFGGEDIRFLNYQRLVDVWLDDFKIYYYATTPIRRRTEETGNLAERRRLRNRLGCRSFRWYLDNVMPEMAVPDKTAVHFGQMENLSGRTCITALNTDNSIDEGSAGSHFLRMTSCAWHDLTQAFSFTVNSTIVHAGDRTRCLTARSEGYVTLEPCSPPFDQQTNQKWTFDVAEPALQEHRSRDIFETGYGGTKRNVGRAWALNDRNRKVCLSQVSLPNGDQIAGLLGCDTSEGVAGYQLWSFTYNLNWS